MEESTSWITSELLQEILQSDPKFSGKSVALQSFSFSTDLAQGYSSTLFRVNLNLIVNESQVNHSYIAKTSIGAPPGALEPSHKNGIFSKENEVLENLIPQFESLYQNVGMEVSFAPKCYKIITTSKHSSMILEDLKPNYKSSSQRLDLEHARVCIKKFAQFHAASVVYQKKNGPLKEMFEQREFGIEYFDSFYHNQMESLLEEIESWEDFDKERKILQSYKSVVHRIYKIWCEVQEGDFEVLCHGDLHNNNIMFKYSSDGSPIEMKMLDFQLCLWTSPIFEIFFFISSCLKEEMKETELDTVLFEYQLALEENLNILGFEGKIPKLRDLQIDLLNRGIIGFIMIIQGMLPSVSTPNNIDSELLMRENSEVSKEFRQKLFSHPKFRKDIKQYIKFMVKRGIFDFNEKI